jgi:zinc protease
MIYVSQSIPLTQVQLAFPTGALEDPPGLEGLASLAMNLLLTGTERLSRRALESRMDALGAHFGATASSDYALVSLEVLSDKLDKALELLEEILLRPALDASEFERLRRLARQEVIADQDDDRAVGSRLFRQFLFRYAGYGRPGGGTLASLDRLTLDHVRAFIRQRLASVPALLGVVSDLPADRLAPFTRHLPYAWADAPLVGAPQSREASPGLRVLLIDKPERTQCQTFMGTMGPWGSADGDYAPLLLGTTVLGGSFTSRLTHEVREKRGLSYGAGCHMTILRNGGLFQARMSPAQDKVLEAIGVVQQVVAEWVAGGINEEETGFVKEFLENQFHFRTETPGMELYQKLTNLLIGRPADFLERYVPGVRATSREQVGEAVRRWFSDAPWTIAVVGTVNAAMEAAFREALHPDQLKVVGYTDELIP